MTDAFDNDDLHIYAAARLDQLFDNFQKAEEQILEERFIPFPRSKWKIISPNSPKSPKKLPILPFRTMLAQKNIQRLKLELSTCQEENNALKRENADLKKDLIALKNALNQSQETLQEKETAVEKIEAVLAEEHQKLEISQVKQQYAINNAEKLSLNLKEEKAASLALKNDKKELQLSLIQIKEAQARLQSLIKPYLKLKKDHELLKENYSKEIVANQMQTEQLNEQKENMRQLSERNDALHEQLIRLMSQNQKIESQLALSYQANLKICNAADTIQNMQIYIDQLNQKLSALNNTPKKSGFFSFLK